MALLITVLKDPAQALQLSSKDWDLLIRQARHANLLGRLYRIFEQSGELRAIAELSLIHI